MKATANGRVVTIDTFHFLATNNADAPRIAEEINRIVAINRLDMKLTCIATLHDQQFLELPRIARNFRDDAANAISRLE